jgi:hypothetical protein
MTPLLEVEALKKHFPIQTGMFSRVSGHVYAVDSNRLERAIRLVTATIADHVFARRGASFFTLSKRKGLPIRLVTAT